MVMHRVKHTRYGTERGTQGVLPHDKTLTDVCCQYSTNLKSGVKKLLGLDAIVFKCVIDIHCDTTDSVYVCMGT